MSEKDDRLLLDTESANVRRTGGCVVQTIPKRWTKRRDLKAFFRSDLEINLLLQNGQVILEIKRASKEET